jgi:hypothetical protein
LSVARPQVLDEHTNVTNGTDRTARQPVMATGANDVHRCPPSWAVEPSTKIGLAIVAQGKCHLLARAGRVLPCCLDVHMRVAAGEAPAMNRSRQALSTASRHKTGITRRRTSSSAPGSLATASASDR